MTVMAVGPEVGVNETNDLIEELTRWTVTRVVGDFTGKDEVDFLNMSWKFWG